MSNKVFFFGTLFSILFAFQSLVAAPQPTPPELWKDYNPHQGDFKEEIIKQETKDGILNKESYISAYVLNQEIRVYCKYGVKVGASKAPGLMNVHGWMGSPNLPKSFIDNGWAVMAHDYCGKTRDRKHFTKYPAKLQHGNMDREITSPIWSETPDHKSISDPKQSSDYIWYAIQRRVLSYLEQQQEVDNTRLGAVGYSYGGTIMWNLATDPRIKAVVAYFGIGWTDYYRNKQVWMYNNPYVEPAKSTGEQIYLASLAPEAHPPFISAATLFLNGSNDHHGGHERGLESFKLFKNGVPWAFAIQARGHHNTEKIDQNAITWLDKYVLNKDIFWTEQPKAEIKLSAEGIPELIVKPSFPNKVKKVEIFYALKEPCSFNRSWRDVTSIMQGNFWSGKLPVLDVNDYLFAYANVTYDTNLTLSSFFNAAIPAKIGNAKATDTKSNTIYNGGEGVEAWTQTSLVEGPMGVKGFRCTNNKAGTINEQLYDPKWRAPTNGQLAFKFYCTQPQTIVLTANNHEVVQIKIPASDTWQEMVIPSKNLINRSNKLPMKDWTKVGKLHFTSQEGSDITKVIFSEFRWEK